MTQTMTVSEAKPRLGALIDLALRSSPVFIRRGRQVVQIVPAVLPDPIPVYPAGALSRSPSELAGMMQTFTADEGAPLAQ